MKKWNRILTALLALALMLSLTVPMSAAEPTPLALNKLAAIKSVAMGDCYVYPYGTTLDATVLKGGSVGLQFKRDQATPRSDDQFWIEIYRGTYDEVAQQDNPQPVETRQYAMSKFQAPAYAISTTWKADSRYSVGDYTALAYVASSEGVFYEQVYYIFGLHVVKSATPATGIELCEIFDGGAYNLSTYYSFDQEVCILPQLLPYVNTDSRSISVGCSDSSAVTASVDAGYVYLRSGGLIGPAEVTIRCGKFSQKITVMFGEVTSASIAATKTTLCVGTTDTMKCTYTTSQGTPKITWKSSNPKVATVKNGVVTAVAPGTADISAVIGDKTRIVKYTVQNHTMPQGTPVSTRTATQSACSVGRCTNCGAENVTVIVEPAIFTDTDAKSWYAEYVDYVYDNKIMTGMTANSFSPDMTMTRGMVATVLYRLAGSPEVTEASPFTDVPEKAYYAAAISWAQANEIVNGYPDNTFRPDDYISREQFAAILYRYTKASGAELREGGDISGFPDGDKVQGWAQEAMRWAVGEKLISGIAVNGVAYLSPANNTTRAQFATIITRYSKSFSE